MRSWGWESELELLIEQGGNSLIERVLGSTIYLFIDCVGAQFSVYPSLGDRFSTAAKMSGCC